MGWGHLKPQRGATAPVTHFQISLQRCCQSLSQKWVFLDIKAFGFPSFLAFLSLASSGQIDGAKLSQGKWRCGKEEEEEEEMATHPSTSSCVLMSL